MKAILATADSLLDADQPDPPPPAGRELLVAVRAVALNPLDAKLRARLKAPAVLGFEAAGVVAAAGPDCRLFRPGDAVMLLAPPGRPGAMAEFTLADERLCGARPGALSFAEAASLPLTGLTAMEAIFDRLRIQRGAEGAAVLVLGGAGGVGSVAIQLLRALTGLRVVATAGSEESRAWCLELGAHDVLDHRGDLAAQAEALGVPVGWVLSAHTAAHWPAICALLAPGGLVCALDEPAALNVLPLRPKAGGLVWEAVFARGADRERQAGWLRALSALVAKGAVRPTLTQPLGPVSARSIGAGLALVAAGRMRGKAVAEGWGALN